MGKKSAELLPLMTVKEKIGQLNQRLHGFHAYEIAADGTIEPSPSFLREAETYGSVGFVYGLHRADPWSGRDYRTGLVGRRAVRAANILQRYLLEHTRLGIPAIFTNEAPHGCQILDGFLLPVNLACGATFHPELMFPAFRRVGEQLRSVGCRMALMSMLDVQRDPRWGRSEECYGEDPLLCASFAEAAVRGIRSASVACVAKHFAAQGQTTGGVNASSASIGMRELRESHRPPAAAAVRAGAEGIMAAYNDIDGIPCHANAWLLQDVLRGEMGFGGIVMADGCAVDQLTLLTGTLPEAARLALLSGIDVSLWDAAFPTLAETALRDSAVMARIDEAVTRVLDLKEELGLFVCPYAEETGDPSVFASAEIAQPSLNLSEESAVLLRNDGILPLRNARRIAVIGPSADDIYRQLGDYSPPVRRENTCTVLDGLRLLAPEDTAISHCVSANEITSDRFDCAVAVLGGSSSRFGGAEFAETGAAKNSTGAMDCGEGIDCSSLSLPEEQTELIRTLSGSGVPFVTVIIAGRAYAISEISRLSPALLYAFYPGPWGGRAIAEILYGHISPSGCLPVSLPRSPAQLPAAYNQRSAWRVMHYADAEDGPLYSFGRGLGYTSFTYGSVRLTPQALSLSVRNDGTMRAGTVIQVYAKIRDGVSVPRVESLIAFQKVFAEGGECVSVTIPLPPLADCVFLSVRDGRGEIWHTDLSSKEESL